jgi:hypothetical protein
MTIEEISLTDIQDFVVREVARSSDFASLVTSLLGTTMVFYRGDDLRVDPGTGGTPYFIAQKFNSNESDSDPATWMVQYVLGVPDAPTAAPLGPDVDGVIVREQTNYVEQLAIAALGIIRQGVTSGGIGGICNLRISAANILTTEVGEADDVQAFVTLRFEAYKTF